MTSAPFIVKVCGITNKEDARIAVDAGANALGFNFYGKSPRYIDPPRAREIVAAAPGNYLKVGIFVNASERDLLDAVDTASLDVLQLYGSLCTLPHRVWRAISAAEPAPAKSDSVEAFVLDAAASQYGGSGKTFDWTLAARFPHRVIIAGGLDAANVAEAIRIASPWGVDACSRLESSPGKKDPQRVRAFIRAALAAASHHVAI